MKFLDITILLFCVNIAISAVNAADLFPSFQIIPQQTWLDSVLSSSSQDQEYFMNSATEQVSSNFGFGDFIRGLVIFVETFAIGLFAPAFILHAFGLNVTLSIMLSLPIYLLYWIGITQLVANRGTKVMD